VRVAGPGWPAALGLSVAGAIVARGAFVHSLWTAGSDDAALARGCFRTDSTAGPVAVEPAAGGVGFAPPRVDGAAAVAEHRRRAYSIRVTRSPRWGRTRSRLIEHMYYKPSRRARTPPVG
jgi:hypothetical protein